MARPSSRRWIRPMPRPWRLARWRLDVSACRRRNPSSPASWDMTASPDAPPPGRWPRSSAEPALLAGVDGARLDARENGYWGLMVLAARGGASQALAGEMTTRVGREIERARGGGTGLGEHACRVLAILGASGVDALIQQVIEQDRFCDRFELQRLRKAVQDGGRDQDSVRELTQLLHVPLRQAHRRRRAQASPRRWPACWPPARPRWPACPAWRRQGACREAASQRPAGTDTGTRRGGAAA